MLSNNERSVCEEIFDYEYKERIDNTGQDFYDNKEETKNEVIDFHTMQTLFNTFDFDLDNGMPNKTISFLNNGKRGRSIESVHSSYNELISSSIKIQNFNNINEESIGNEKSLGNNNNIKIQYINEESIENEKSLSNNNNINNNIITINNINNNNIIITNNNNIINNNDLKKKDNEIDEHKNINNTIPEYIDLYTFNKTYYDKHKNSITKENRTNTIIIKTINQISQENKNEFAILFEKIFLEESDLIDIERDGIIYKNAFNVMNGENHHITMKKFSPDNLIRKLKTFIKNANREAINTFEELKYKINILMTGDDKLENIGKYFNLAYLEQPLYAVLSNETKENTNITNYSKIEGIIKEYNKNKKKTPLIKHLCLTVKDSLDILKYKKEDIDKRYKEKIFNYVEKEYNNNKFDEKDAEELGENLEFLKKDYTASLIFLAYNFEDYFIHKKERVIDKSNNII